MGVFVAIIPNSFISAQYTRNVIEEAGENIKLPDDFELQSMTSEGNYLCLDDCTQARIIYKSPNYGLENVKQKLFNGLLDSGYFEYNSTNYAKKSCIFSTESDYCLKTKVDNLLLQADIITTTTADGSEITTLILIRL